MDVGQPPRRWNGRRPNRGSFKGRVSRSVSSRNDGGAPRDPLRDAHVDSGGRSTSLEFPVVLARLNMRRRSLRTAARTPLFAPPQIVPKVGKNGYGRSGGTDIFTRERNRECLRHSPLPTRGGYFRDVVTTPYCPLTRYTAAPVAAERDAFEINPLDDAPPRLGPARESRVCGAGRTDTLAAGARSDIARARGRAGDMLV